MLQQGGVQCEFCRPANEAGLEHKGQSALQFDWLEFRRGGAVEGFGVGAVAGHAIVEAGASGDEALGFGVVFALNEAHEFVHEIAVEPGGTEGVFGHHPAWRKEDEVHVCGSGDFAWRGEDGENAGIRVVETYGVDRVEAGKIVFVGSVIAVPGDNIERGVIEVGCPEASLKFCDNLEGGVVAVVVGGVGGVEVAGVGKAVGSDGAEVREAEGLAVVFEEVASTLRFEESYAELDASGDDGDFAGRELKDAELGVEGEASQLGHKEQFAVGGVEETVGHAFVRGVDVDGDTGVHGRVAIAGQRGEAVDEVGGLVGQREWVPAELVGWGFDFGEGGRADESVADALVGLVHDGGSDAIGPRAAVEQAGRGEGAAAELLGVEAGAGFLRGVLADGECAGDRFGGELIAEAGEVVEIGHWCPLGSRQKRMALSEHRSLTDSGWVCFSPG